MVPAPQSRMGPSDDASLAGIVRVSPLSAKYGESVDRQSAYEMLLGAIAADSGPQAADTEQPADPYAGMTPEQRLEAEILGNLPTPSPTTTVPAPPAPAPAQTGRAAPKSSTETLVETFLKSAAESLGREISRGVFGNRRRRR